MSIIGKLNAGAAVKFLFLMACAATVAWLVVGFRIDNSGQNDTWSNSASPIGIEDRATTSLTETTIQPVLSGDARVVPGSSADSWILEAPVKPADQAYRLLTDPIGVKAQIDGGPSGFDCEWRGLGTGGDSGGVTMRCQIPDGITVVEGLQGTMVLQLEQPVKVMALPLTAVLGSAERGQVVVVHEDFTTDTRSVDLGKSDSSFVEVVSGLAPGELVLTAPVQTDFVRSETLPTHRMNAFPIYLEMPLTKHARSHSRVT